MNSFPEKHVSLMKAKIKADGIDVYNKKEVIRCLSGCVRPSYMIRIYLEYMENE
jgi:hypothetical protein